MTQDKNPSMAEARERLEREGIVEVESGPSAEGIDAGMPASAQPAPTGAPTGSVGASKASWGQQQGDANLQALRSLENRLASIDRSVGTIKTILVAAAVIWVVSTVVVLIFYVAALSSSGS